MSDDKMEEFETFMMDNFRIVEYELLENDMKAFVYRQHYSSTDSSKVNQSIDIDDTNVVTTQVFSISINLMGPFKRPIQRTYNLNDEEPRVYYDEIVHELFTIYEETENVIETVYRVLDKFPGKEGLYDNVIK